MLAGSLRRWLPPILWMGLIFLLSSIPEATISRTGWVDFVIRKLIHLFEYAVLAILLSRNLKKKFAVLFSILYAVADEIHQSFVPGRIGTWKDVLVDGLGAWLGLFLWSCLKRKIARLSRW